MLELYQNIKARRIELGLSQSQLAEMTGYADKTATSTWAVSFIGMLRVLPIPLVRISHHITLDTSTARILHGKVSIYVLLRS